MPFTVKDGVATAGVGTTYGSRLFEGHVPDTDATVVTRLKDAGSVLMAKTNLEAVAWGRQVNMMEQNVKGIQEALAERRKNS